MHLGQVETQRGFALAREGALQRRFGDEGVAVAVPADPVAHAEEARDLVARQCFLDLAIEPRDLAQEGRVVVAQRVFDLVGNRQLRGAQHARLPQLRDAGAQQRLVLGAVALGGQRVALADEFGDGTLGVEDALALHLGRVGREHRADVGVCQGARDLVGADVGLRQALHRHRQRAFLQMALAFVVVAAADVVAVFGDVRQVREVAEGADHAHRLVARQVLQQPVERTAGLRIALQPVGHRELAHALDEFESLLALLLADHVAEDATEQADVFHQRAVLLGRVLRSGTRRRAGRRAARSSFFVARHESLGL